MLDPQVVILGLGVLSMAGVLAGEWRKDRASMRSANKPTQHELQPDERWIDGHHWVEERGAIYEQLRALQALAAGTTASDYELREKLNGIVLKFEKHLERLDGHMARAQEDIRDIKKGRA